ncbi:arylsulfatase [Maribacter polysaccharolyticus]|uniref:arylsulfatase n=1 Tax=Maribacter polysaccharolyticus TaxID=3020831 RepID=UPI00237F135F|nr:arylsulfatase [Maribacter polysaccharolyticus]MDE3742137.1 arylsulfatase [Maribacter polysaccharolyticus]
MKKRIMKNNYMKLESVTIIYVLLFFGISSRGMAQNEQSKSKSLKNSRPNIILVMTDDQGMGDLSCMGNEILKTPHIDDFHENSTRLTDFQVSPTCAPTRSAIMSGRVPFKNGVTHTIFQRERMALDVYTLPQALQSAGYKTALFGKWHLGDEEAYLPNNRGFDEVLMHGAGGIGQSKYGDFPTNSHDTYSDNVLLHNDTIVQTKGFCTDLFFKASLAWIKEQHETEHPYFAYISLNAPHGPFYDNAPEEYQKRFLKAGYDKKTAVRYGMIENIDDNFGIMMSKLKDWDALENTIVIFMTDNGMSMPPITHNGEKFRAYNAGMKGGKNSPYEGGTHVPFFMQWEGVLEKGVDINALTAHIDLYKTFSELAGVESPEKMQDIDGRSLVPLLENKDVDWDERELFVHCGRWNTGERENYKFKKNAVRTDRWRFSNNKELYDILVDPGETKNVYGSYPDVVKELQQSYDQWWESVKPMMVNENLPEVAPEDQPLVRRYHRQLKEYGIPNWAPENLK